MSLMDRICVCNNANLQAYLPLLFKDKTIGWIDPAFARRMSGFVNVFSVDQDKIALAPTDASYQELSDQVNSALRKIYDQDQSGFGYWCDEMAPVVPELGHWPVFEVDRCAVAPLGILSTGVHLNGFVSTKDAISMWVARRSHHIAAQPRKLDQIVGGFLPAGADPIKQLMGEAHEEAGIHAGMLEGVVPAGRVNFCMKVPLGVQRGGVLVYDLELPADFTPVNQDGEVGEFILMKTHEVISILENGNEFKFDCALIAIDFLIRHGEIGTSYPGYGELLRGLGR